MLQTYPHSAETLHFASNATFPEACDNIRHDNCLSNTTEQEVVFVSKNYSLMRSYSDGELEVHRNSEEINRDYYQDYHGLNKFNQMINNQEENLYYTKDAYNTRNTEKPSAYSFPKLCPEALRFDFDDYEYTNSTENSEKVKSLDDERFFYCEKKMSDFMSGSSSPLVKSNNNYNLALFTMCLETEEGNELVTIYENEDDYEEQLNEICEQFGMTERHALHFKINILQMIKDCTSTTNEKLDDSLARLMALNFNYILAEHVPSDNNEYLEILSDIRSLFDN